MALKDLKSNLSDFRKPKSEPLKSKERPQPTSFSTTPLSDKVQGKKAPTPNPTPEKLGVTPTEVKQGDKFKGETSPTPMSLVERFLGQTETTPIVQGDKFKGETSPTEVNQSEKFKGETTPTEVNQSEKFKGETNPTEVNQSEKFKGETSPTEVNQSEKFKGETTPSEFKFTQQFLGETTPSDFKFSQQFLGETTPKEANNSEQFLGETTPKEANNSEQFLGETTPKSFNNSSNFLGETTPKEANNSEQFLGETDTKNITQGDRFKGETTPKDFSFNPNLDSQGKDPKFVNFITDDKAVGFSPYFSTVDDTKFVGVNPDRTQFDGTTSLFGGIKDKKYDVRLDNDSGLGTFYSNSVLKDTYNKFSLKNDAYNRSPIKQPFIIRGIQRKKGEPQVTGVGSTSLIRGGAITAVERGLLDVARMTQFLLTPRGIVWAVKQVGLQKSQKFATKWNPVNLLGTIGGSHTGFRPERAGAAFQNPLDGYFKIGTPLQIDNSNSLEALYGVGGQRALSQATGLTWQTYQGGFNSVYGLGVTTITRKYNSLDNASIDFANKNGGNQEVNFKVRFNPFDIALKTYEDSLRDGDTYKSEFDNEVDRFAKINIDKGSDKDKFDRTVKSYHKQNIEKGGSKFNPFAEKEPGKLYQDSVPADDDEKLKYGVAAQVDNDGKLIDDENKLKPNLLESEGFIPSSPDVADYSAISYGLVSKISKQKHKNQKSYVDYRQENGVSKGFDRWDGKKLEVDKKFNNPGEIRTDGNKTIRNTDQFNEQNAKNLYRGDEIQSQPIGTVNETGDLVALIFRIGSDALQFRGTISGLTENFSPTYSEIKYSGRAEPVYVYDAFKRDISFNFKVYPTSRSEMKPLWKKLERLSTYAMPDYLTNGFTAPGDSSGRELNLTIGKLYVKTPMILTTLGYTYSDDTPWDLDYGLPMGIDINVGCTVLGNALHEYKNEEVYSFDTKFRQ